MLWIFAGFGYRQLQLIDFCFFGASSLANHKISTLPQVYLLLRLFYFSIFMKPKEARNILLCLN